MLLVFTLIRSTGKMTHRGGRAFKARQRKSWPWCQLAFACGALCVVVVLYRSHFTGSASLLQRSSATTKSSTSSSSSSSENRDHPSISPPTFTYTRPRCHSIMDFLQNCGSSDDEESVQRITHALGPTHPLLPVLASLNHTGDSVTAAQKLNFSTAARALRKYEHLWNKQGEGKLPKRSSFTCVPWTVPPPAEGSKHRIGIVILKSSYEWILDKDALQLSLEDKQAYADKHGYDLHVISEKYEFERDDKTHASPVWWKWPAVLEWLPNYDWVMLMDLDTVFLDHSVRLHEFLDPRFEVVMSTDNWLNAGVMFLRRSAWTTLLLAESWATRPRADYWHEQAALTWLIDEHREIRNHVKVVRQDWFNQYVGRKGVNDAFIVHFAGRPNRSADMREYVAKRKHASVA